MAAAAAARSVERSGRNRRHMCCFTTARHEGHKISEIWQELEEEVRLAESNGRSCLEGNWSATDVRAGHDRIRRPPGTHSTVPVRRGEIGEDAGHRRSLAQGRFSSPCKTTRLRNFPTGGGSGDKRRQSRWYLLTTADRRIVAPQLFNLNPWTPNAKSRSRHGKA